MLLFHFHRSLLFPYWSKMTHAHWVICEICVQTNKSSGKMRRHFFWMRCVENCKLKFFGQIRLKITSFTYTRAINFYAYRFISSLLCLFSCCGCLFLVLSYTGALLVAWYMFQRENNIQIWLSSSSIQLVSSCLCGSPNGIEIPAYTINLFRNSVNWFMFYRTSGYRMHL